MPLWLLKYWHLIAIAGLLAASVLLGGFAIKLYGESQFKLGVTAEQLSQSDANLDRLVKASEAMAASFSQTSKIMEELHDNAPDNKNSAGVGITRTANGMRERQKANGKFNTNPAP